MMEVKFEVTNKTVVIGFLTQLFQYGANVIILPYILATIESKTLGIWYVFLSVSNLAMLLDFGFSSALGRNVSYVFSGASNISKEGVVKIGLDSKINYELLNSIIYTTKITYRRIAILILLLLISFGSFYIYHVTNNFSFLPTWIIFSISISVNYYYNYVVIFLRGKGLVNECNNLIIVTRSLYVILLFVLLLFGLELWALICATILSTIASRCYGYFLFWDKELISNLKKCSNIPSNLFSTIWYNAKRIGISSFTTYGYSQANVLIGGLFLTLENVASLGLTIQVFTILVTLSRVYLNTLYPKICYLWVKNDINAIRLYFLKSQIMAYVIYFFGLFIILFWGDLVLKMLHSKTELPVIGVLSLFGFFYFMEITHGNCAILIGSKNTVPFYKADIIACFTTIIAQFFFLNHDFGLYSFPLAMCCSSLPYNSWKWVYEAYLLLNKFGTK